MQIKRQQIVKHFRFTKADILVLVVIVIPYLVVVNYIMLGSMYLTFPLLVETTLTSMVIVTASWAAHIVVSTYFRNRIKGYSKTLRRVLIQIPIYIVLSIGMGIALFTSFHMLGFIDKPLIWSNFRPVFIAGLILNIAATSFHEGLYAFNSWKAAILETEQLKKNYLQSQLEGLKSQVNPHFLFNSLNSLSALIYSNPEKASDFVDQMSKVYRYLLHSNERLLIRLHAELNFAESFFAMLKTRHEEGICIYIDVDDMYKDGLLPPLTLQMLLENAVKHNIVSRQQPLKIEVYISGTPAKLIVRNNIQKKKTIISSTGIGLRNITNKYKLLHSAVVEIIDDGHYFTVKLPIFTSKEYDYFDH